MASLSGRGDGGICIECGTSVGVMNRGGRTERSILQIRRCGKGYLCDHIRRMLADGIVHTGKHISRAGV
jgi:hypothetical protein